MKHFLKLYQIEQKLFFRNADVFIFSLCMPVVTLLMICLACVIFGYRMEGNVLAFIGAWFLTMIAMFSIGLLAASVCKTVKSMNVVTSLLYFPILFFSGATIPYELFPKGMQKVAGLMPLGVGIRLMKAASMGTMLAEVDIQIIILVLITLVCSLVAVKMFRWE